ncbi:FG-GAP repeat domain-containing protein, partial [Planctomycetota bacterium]
NINVINYDSRFTVKKVPVTARIDAIQLVDLNKDKKKDIMFLGQPGGLFIFLQKENGEFEKERNIEINNPLATDFALTCTKLAPNDPVSVILFCKKEILIYNTEKDPNFSSPVKVPLEESFIKSAKDVFINDFDGNGRKDIVFASPFSKQSLWVTFQNEQGTFGPFHAFDLGKYRSLRLFDTDGNGRPELFYIEQISGRMIVSEFKNRKDDTGKQLFSDVILYPYPSAEARERDIAVGDVNNDAILDIIVTEPSISAVSLFLQQETASFTRFQIFPSLINAQKVFIQDMFPSPGNEVLIFSKKENIVGTSSFQKKGGVSFPKPLALQGKLSTITLADINGDSIPDLVYTSEIKNKDKKERIIRIKPGLKQGGFSDSEIMIKPEKSFKTDPSEIEVFDINGDKKMDAIIFVPYEKHFRIFVQAEDNSFKDITQEKGFNSGIIEQVKHQNFSIIDYDNNGTDEFIITRKNFARILTIDGSQVKILDQINSPLDGAVSAVIPLSIDGKGKKELLLYDAGFNKLIVMQKKANSRYEPIETITIDAISIDRIYTADFTNNGIDDILIKGRNKFGIIPRGSSKGYLSLVTSYETKIKDGKYGFAEVGDFTADGSSEVILIEAQHHIIEFLAFRNNKLAPAVKFKIFESGPGGTSTVYGRQKGSIYEPREIAFEDINGDSIPDLIVIVHDRIIVYFQEQLK